MPKKKSKLINLLPAEEFETSLTGRVLKWAMTTFRYIVIVTEMIVMGAFLSRFWLDAKNSDLNDALKVKSAQISAQKEFEKDFRDLQGRLKIFQEIKKDTPSSTILTKIIEKLPNEVSLQSVSYQAESIQVKGVATSEFAVAQLVSNIKADSTFKKVELGQIGSSENNQALTVFTIRISY